MKQGNMGRTCFYSCADKFANAKEGETKPAHYSPSTNTLIHSMQLNTECPWPHQLSLILSLSLKARGGRHTSAREGSREPSTK